jgi:hypothetical protein
MTRYLGKNGESPWNRSCLEKNPALGSTVEAMVSRYRMVLPVAAGLVPNGASLLDGGGI